MILNVFFGNRVSYIPSHPETCYIAKDAPKCWDYKPMPPCLIYTVQKIKLGTLGMLGKYSTNRTIFLAQQNTFLSGKSRKVFLSHTTTMAGLMLSL